MLPSEGRKCPQSAMSRVIKRHTSDPESRAPPLSGRRNFPAPFRLPNTVSKRSPTLQALPPLRSPNQAAEQRDRHAGEMQSTLALRYPMCVSRLSRAVRDHGRSRRVNIRIGHDDGVQHPADRRNTPPPLRVMLQIAPPESPSTGLPPFFGKVIREREAGIDRLFPKHSPPTMLAFAAT